MRLERKLTIIMISFLIIAIAGSALMNHFNPSGYEEVSIIRVINNTIILGNNCTAISATTSPDRALSIQLGLEGIIDKRPTTHDTITQILKDFNITLDSVTIERKDKDFYYSNMHLSGGDKILSLDTMPSDAVAIALRTNSTVYINKTLLKEEGFDICGHK